MVEQVVLPRLTKEAMGSAPRSPREFPPGRRQAAALAPGLGEHLQLTKNSNGHGSTNTKIQRWTTANTNTGSSNSFTYADSATAGMSITIQSGSKGIYCAEMNVNYSTTGRMGFSLNSTQLTDINPSLLPIDLWQQMSDLLDKYDCGLVRSSQRFRCFPNS